LVEIIVERAKTGKNYGVILVPEGLIEFISEMNVLIKEINHVMAKIEVDKRLDGEDLFKLVHDQLTDNSQKLLTFLPKNISEQLLLDRDPHGNVQVAKIETEKLIIELVTEGLKNTSNYKGEFSPMSNYFGYEGRCAFPTNFDCDYCYSLGVNAAAIIETGHTGLMSCIRNLSKEPEEWLAGGYPLVTMMDIETRKGKNVPVITKALVDLDGVLFGLFKSERGKWAREDYFNTQGPIQFEFPSVNPFLAVPPTLESLYFNCHNKTYESKAPYAKMYNYNMNNLTYELTKSVPSCPSILR
jgi:diphosphate--fructose-6-phosphate 1-phosphotransferase